MVYIVLDSAKSLILYFSRYQWIFYKLSMLRLDANESPFNSPENLYPDRELTAVKKLWGQYEHIPPSYIYLCNGTEESVDLCIRSFVEPFQGEILTVTPTRSVYIKRASVNRVTYRECLLSDDYKLDVDSLLSLVTEATKLIFLCSPNSPTGNSFSRSDIELILQRFDGFLVLDESFIDFCLQNSKLSLLNTYDNLIILRSFSHAWSSAGARLASIVAHPQLIQKIESVGLTHPLNTFAINYFNELLDRRVEVHKWVRQIVEERTKVVLALKALPLNLKVYHSDANFVFVTNDKKDFLYQYLLKHGVSVRNTGGGLRISIGMPRDNSVLLSVLRTIRTE